jgi:hypothetical protein
MVGQSNRDRSYLMALCAWKTFGHTSESQKMFAGRMADIGNTSGVDAAAEAIAEDCRKHGLQMSKGRVLKSLAFGLQRYSHLLSGLNSIEEFPVEELGRRPPGIDALR